MSWCEDPSEAKYLYDKCQRDRETERQANEYRSSVGGG
jgi:hypothetical protein